MGKDFFFQVVIGKRNLQQLKDFTGSVETIIHADETV
jgi:hypothetical protein